LSSPGLLRAPGALWSALVFASAIAVVNGFGRFAYAILLPVMRDDLRWDYALAGWLNTANSLGYGLGALAGMWLLAYLRPATLFIGGLATTVFTLGLCGLTTDLWWMMLWRLLAGIVSAWVFSCGGALIAARFPDNKDDAAAAIAIYYAGGGLGIALSGGLLLPVLDGHWGWPTGWMVLGLAGLALAVWPAKMAREIGGKTSEVSSQPIAWRPFTPALIAYFLFGVGYIVYLTFVVAWMREKQLGVTWSMGVWVILGLAVTASGWLWRQPMARWWPATTFASASLCTALGTVVPLISGELAALIVSALLVGGSFFMVPGSVMALVRLSLPPAQWAKCMNLFTMIFAIGQAAGPVLAGGLADRFGLNTAMLAAAAVLLAGSAIVLLQRPR
jgi:predicted MFS family arabinose efflux permease